MEHVYRMELQYDGTGLHGWAKQPGLSTVEGALERALQTVLGYVPSMQVAGRTDAGVHARRQVVSLDLPAGADLARLRESLNALTPPGIIVTRVVKAPQGFDARRQALARTYRYYVCATRAAPPFWSRYCWAVYGTVDFSTLGQAAALVLGRHDFTAFTPAQTEHLFFHRKVVKCVWRRAGADLAGLMPAGRRKEAGHGLVYLEIEADSFMRHMVRTLVGTMLEVAQGRRSLDELQQLLLGARREQASPTAPPQGLFLWNIRYAAGAMRRASDSLAAEDRCGM